MGARSRILVVGLVAALMGVGVTVPAALAVPSITTSYPAISTVAGEQLDIELQVDGSPGERVALELASVPENWEATLRAGGYTVGAVTVPPGGEEPASATLEVQVPPDAEARTHELVVEASSNQGTDRLPIDVTISDTAQSAVTLDTEFTTLTGAPEDTFSWSVTLNNDVPEELTFQLSAQGPQGWQVSATPSTESRANAVTVEGGGTATVNVEATPPTGVSAGTYPIVLQVSGGGRSAQIELTAEVTGSVQLSMTTATERLNASGNAGEATPVTLVVANDGSAPAQGVSMSASPPTDWEVQFEPATIESIPPGQSANVTARVIPADDAVVGDYVVTMTADAQGNQAQSEIRFTVETSGLWGLTAIIVIILVIAVLAEIFRRYGRR